jgi:hypothetical protein
MTLINTSKEIGLEKMEYVLIFCHQSVGKISLTVKIHNKNIENRIKLKYLGMTVTINKITFMRRLKED